jgi:cysteine-rich repeat protein
MSEFFSPRIRVSGALCLAAVGCGSEPSGSVSRDQPIEYSVQLTAARPASLPRCTTGSSGTVAHVDSPSSLWTCGFGRWREIPCSLSNSGDVAYSSVSPALWACVKGEWTSISLPGGSTGPTGSTGPRGPTGPMGSTGLSSLIRVTAEPASMNCAEGGVRIETGIDDDADGMLDPTTEVDATSFVCNGNSPTVCGDGHVDPGEECDNGRADTAECDYDCTRVRCGDAHVNVVAGEECEDANVISGDGCSSICRKEPVSCQPGGLQCASTTSVQTCLADGTFGPPIECTAGQSCTFGHCL